MFFGLGFGLSHLQRGEAGVAVLRRVLGGHHHAAVAVERQAGEPRQPVPRQQRPRIDPWQHAAVQARQGRRRRRGRRPHRHVAVVHCSSIEPCFSVWHRKLVLRHQVLSYACIVTCQAHNFYQRCSRGGAHSMAEHRSVEYLERRVLPSSSACLLQGSNLAVRQFACKTMLGRHIVSLVNSASGRLIVGRPHVSRRPVVADYTLQPRADKSQCKGRVQRTGKHLGACAAAAEAAGGTWGARACPSARPSCRHLPRGTRPAAAAAAEARGGAARAAAGPVAGGSRVHLMVYHVSSQASANLALASSAKQKQRQNGVRDRT